MEHGIAAGTIYFARKTFRDTLWRTMIHNVSIVLQNHDDDCTIFLSSTDRRPMQYYILDHSDCEGNREKCFQVTVWNADTCDYHDVRVQPWDQTTNDKQMEPGVKYPAFFHHTDPQSPHTDLRSIREFIASWATPTFAECKWSELGRWDQDGESKLLTIQPRKSGQQFSSR